MELEQLQALAAAYHILGEELAQKVDDKTLLVHAIKGMLKGADPEAGEYYTPTEFEEWRNGSAADGGAVGVEVRLKDGQFELSPIEGGPAMQAGVMFGDHLHAIDGQRVKGMERFKVTQRLAGPLGSRVTLTVFREASLKVLEIPVERRAFTPPGVTMSRPAADAVVLRVPHFRDSTLQEAANELLKAWSERPFAAVILDLRGCPGGLLETALGVAAIFLPQGEVVTHARGEGIASNHTYLASPSFYDRKGRGDQLAQLPAALRRLPVVVMVDGGTASGAEIVAAALQDHKRAKVLGTQTYGRASIQTVRPLQMGGVKYTTSFWTSPAGRKLHGVGIAPDISVEDPWSSAALALAISTARSN